MDKVQELLDYLQADLKEKMQEVIDGKLSIEQFIADYSGRKQQYVEIERKAEMDSTVQFLVKTITDLLTEIKSLKEARKDSDALIKRLSSENKQLKYKNEQLEKTKDDNYDDYKRWKEQFDKWKESPYYLHSPSDWPPGLGIDSIFDSVFRRPHFSQSNKV